MISGGDRVSMIHDDRETALSLEGRRSVVKRYSDGGGFCFVVRYRDPRTPVRWKPMSVVFDSDTMHTPNPRIWTFTSGQTDTRMKRKIENNWYEWPPTPWTFPVSSLDRMTRREKRNRKKPAREGATSGESYYIHRGSTQILLGS